MPIYEYECTKCHAVEEVIQKFSDKPLKKCKKCSGHLQKLVSHSSFHLKGNGWYVTDYANKSRNPSKSSKNMEKKAKTETKTSSAESGKSNKSADKKNK